MKELQTIEEALTRIEKQSMQLDDKYTISDIAKKALTKLTKVTKELEDLETEITILKSQIDFLTETRERDLKTRKEALKDYDF